MGELVITPITLKDAKAFILEHHRHNKPPVGWKFGVSLVLNGAVIGVATAGRPVARYFDDGLTLEVNRSCTDGTPNANSMLYGAIWRAGKAMGYQRCITYTQANESGVSLKAAGFTKVKDIPANNGWDSPSRPRLDIGSAGISRVLWEIKVLNNASE